jgi:hypothetical protein
MHVDHLRRRDCDRLKRARQWAKARSHSRFEKSQEMPWEEMGHKHPILDPEEIID